MEFGTVTLSSNKLLLASTLLFPCLAGCRAPDEHAAPAPTERKAEHAPPVAPILSLQSEGLPTDGMWKCDPLLIDFNKDGRLDLLAHPRLGFGPRLFLQEADGTWSEQRKVLPFEGRSCGGGAAVGDLNGDGELDIALADHCQGIFVYLRTGPLSWSLAVRAMPVALAPADRDSVDMFQGAEDLDLGDFDGDGNLDIIVAASDDGGIRCYRGDGTGTTWDDMSDGLPTRDWGNRVLASDVLGDDRPEFLASMGDGPRVWSYSSGTWIAHSEGLPEPLMKGLYWGIATADFNEDGKADIATANWIDGPEVYLQIDTGVWAKQPDVFPRMLGGASGLAVGDVTGNGRADIVVTGRLDRSSGFSRGVFLLEGKPGVDCAFEFLPRSGLPPSGFEAFGGAAVADVNADGQQDVIAAGGLIVESTRTKEPLAHPQKLLVWTGCLFDQSISR